MNRKLIRQTAVFVGIAALFFILSYAYVPQVLSGKVVNQSDFSAWNGMAHETAEHNAAHPDDKTLWTGSMFSGMPNVTMYDDFSGDWTKPLYKLLMSGARPANFLFISLLGAFLMMLAFGVSPILAVAGAIAVTFCSYNFQIIQVGHNTKMQAIAFMPWVLAGLAFTYRSALNAAHNRRKWLSEAVLGSVLFALALSFQVKANHPQITYYLAIIIFIYAIVLLVWVLARRRDLAARFFTASALLLVVGCIGIATNLNKLIPTYEYTAYTMRGGSELESEGNGNRNGLDLGYATEWSYGIEETPNLMIPNFNGGSSSEGFDTDSKSGELLKKKGYDPRLAGYLTQYHGPQPFTAGPMYIGAISIFLFILGMVLYRGKEKWWLLAATVIAILLAWGSHLMWFTRLWFDFAPMYNKFRTVSMALTILQVTVPLLGIMVLDRIMKEEYEGKSVSKGVLTALGISAGFIVLSAAIYYFTGTFFTEGDLYLERQLIGMGMESSVAKQLIESALPADRTTLMMKDAVRSIILVCVMALLIIWVFRTKEPFAVKGRTWIVGAATVALIFFDLGTVGKRYLNKSHFVNRKDFSGQFAERPADKAVKADKELSYRVLDMSVNTFNDAHQSYHHKCIGGYSPAKLQRYQDLITHYISHETEIIRKTVNASATASEVESNLPYLPVVSALNGKYIIIQGDVMPVVNRYAFGNCWFVDEVVGAKSPDEELDLLGCTDLRTTAIVGEDFSGAREEIASCVNEDDGSYVIMTHYAPNELRYSCNLVSRRAVIFSEIYYPKGWKMWLETTDGAQIVDLFRADWILRGAVLPEGEYQLVMRYEPDSYVIGERLSRASSITLLLLLVLSCGALAFSSRKA